MTEPTVNSALARMRLAAIYQHPVALSWIECRCLLIHLDTMQSTVAITTTPEFHNRVQRYRKTGKL
jgi:hypothetical protein